MYELIYSKHNKEQNCWLFTKRLQLPIELLVPLRDGMSNTHYALFDCVAL